MDATKANFGLKDPMTLGLQQQKHKSATYHPLEASEKNYNRRLEAAQMDQLRSIQGSHAPFRLAMEKRCVAKVGHLPCITQRSNLLLDVLEGRDETISFDDIYGKPENHEGLSMPHNVVERSLGNI